MGNVTTIKGVATLDENGNKVVRVNISKKKKLSLLEKFIKFVKSLFK